MKKYYIVCDYRERNKNSHIINGIIIDDHYSLNAVSRLIEIIKELGYECMFFGGVDELISSYKSGVYDKNGIYLNFNDGLSAKSKRAQTPVLLEMMGVSFSGSSSLTHLIVSDKSFTNEFLKNKIDNLIIPKSIKIQKNKTIKPFSITYPVIVKPNDEGSSIGITENSICHSFEQLEDQVAHMNNYNELIVQEFVNGIEITDFVITDGLELLFNEPIIISKNDCIQMNNNIFTSEDKFLHRRKFHDINKYLNSETIKNVKQISKDVSLFLGIKGLGRIDYRIFDDKIYFIEANTIPALSETSDVGEICKLNGISFTLVIDLFLKTIN